MGNFLYRMVQRAVGAPAVTPPPQAPRQFHWPAAVDFPALRSNAVRLPSNPTPLQRGREQGESSRFGQKNEQSNAGQEGLAFSEQGQAPGGPPNPGSSPVANEMTFSEVTASQTGVARDDIRTVASHAQTTPVLITEITRSSQAPQPPGTTAALARRASGPPRPSTADADSHAAYESLSTAIGRAIHAINSEAIHTASIHAESIQADAIETVPRAWRSIVAKRQDSLGPQQKPSAAAAQRFDAHPSPPPVEVRIGSVEIVFDPPAAASHPVPVRPAGFAEFADLRRYATRPWPATRR